MSTVTSADGTRIDYDALAALIEATGAPAAQDHSPAPEVIVPELARFLRSAA